MPALYIAFENLNIIVRVIYFILLEIMVIVEFIKGIKMISSADEPINKYIKKSGIPYEMLEK